MYTNVKRVGNNILLRAIKNDRRISKKIPFNPSLFIEDENSKIYKSLFNKKLKEIKFDSINDSNEFLQNHKDIENVTLYGSSDYVCQYMESIYANNQIDYDFTKLNIISLDIETTTNHGKVDLETTPEEITIITVKNFQTKQITSFGIFDFTIDEEKIKKILLESNSKVKLNLKKFVYHKCSSEKDLLTSFLEFISNEHPDIITGWSVKYFDIPYIIKRSYLLLEEHQTNRLSHWNKIKESVVEKNNRLEITYEIVGTEILDYLDLYKKFIFVRPENYKLDTISEEELGQRKLKSGYNKFKDFYTKDPYKFVIYNLIDVELIDLLEEKLKLIQLATEIAYESKVNFSDVYSPIKVWDNIIYHYMMEKKIVPNLYNKNENKSIIGGYVQEPIPGMYDWCMAFDATSLYPSIFMAFNMSPDTLIETKHYSKEITYDSIDEFDNLEYSLTGNGYFYKRDKQGLFPEIIEYFFKKRQIAKKEMLKTENEYNQTLNKSLENKISSLHNKQMAIKILLNSLYGASANPYFRFFDLRIAEGITITARLILQYVKKHTDIYLSKLLKNEKEYVIYCDTDSVHLCLKDIVEKNYKNNTDREICNILSKIGEDLISKKIEKICSNLGDRLNMFDKSKLSFKREFIATRGVYIAKKRYCLNVLNSEGVDYDPPKLKTMGVEIVRSSSPKYVRKKMKEAVDIILNKTEDDLIQFVEQVKNEWYKLPYQTIAFPRTANNISRYYDKDTRWKIRTPVHVKASIIFNELLKIHNINDTEYIQDGNRMMFIYIKEPNPFNNNAIAYIDEIPEVFNIIKYIDYDTMFEKAFLQPLKAIINASGLKIEKTNTLDDLFM